MNVCFRRFRSAAYQRKRWRSPTTRPLCSVATEDQCPIFQRIDWYFPIVVNSRCPSVQRTTTILKRSLFLSTLSDQVNPKLFVCNSIVWEEMLVVIGYIVLFMAILVMVMAVVMPMWLCGLLWCWLLERWLRRSCVALVAAVAMVGGSGVCSGGNGDGWKFT